AELRATGARVAFHGADLRDPAQIAELVAATGATFGAPDILVNNAVVRGFAPVEDFAPAAWDEALAVNLSAPFHATRLALPGMKRAGWGRIVNLASVYGLFATVNRIDYITTKTALLGLTRAVALEVAKTAITCNAICPGTVLTPAIEARLDVEVARTGATRAETEAAFIGARQPSARFVATDSVAGLVAFLCGPSAADINGAALPIDGAWSAGR
ncbi:MAG: SDR family oxidoreductase, partial [Acetobacteraceae bacterium]